MRKVFLGLILVCATFGARLPAEAAIDPDVLAAARAASDVYQRHIATLLHNAAHGTAEDRINAINTLGHSVDPTVGPQLLPFLDADLNPADVVEAAIHACALLGFTGCQGDLRKLLDHENEALDRAARNGLSLLELQSRGDYEGEAVMRDGDLRGSGVTNIGTKEIAAATPILVRALDDRSKHVRRMAAIALGRMGTPEVGHDLVRALHDPDQLVRRYACEALTRIDFKEAIPFLLLSLESNIAGGDVNRALVTLSGEDFGWRSTDNRVLQQEAVERGFVWWTANAASFGE